jgi:hypothetical protein
MSLLKVRGISIKNALNTAEDVCEISMQSGYWMQFKDLSCTDVQTENKMFITNTIEFSSKVFIGL